MTEAVRRWEMGKIKDGRNSQGIRVAGGERRGVTTGHFTKLMGWESLAASAGLKGFTVGHWSRGGYYEFKSTIFLYRR